VHCSGQLKIETDGRRHNRLLTSSCIRDFDWLRSPLDYIASHSNFTACAEDSWRRFTCQV